MTDWYSGKFKLGDRVRILGAGKMKGRVIEIRGRLGPGGAQIYRVKYRGRQLPAYIEVREDQLEIIPPNAYRL